ERLLAVIANVLVNRHSDTFQRYCSSIGERAVLLRLAAESQHVSVGVFDAHLVSPRVVGRPLNELRATASVLLAKSVNVAISADPEPRSGISLASFTKHDGMTIARYGREGRVAIAGVSPV